MLLAEADACESSPPSDPLSLENDEHASNPTAGTRRMCALNLRFMSIPDRRTLACTSRRLAVASGGAIRQLTWTPEGPLRAHRPTSLWAGMGQSFNLENERGGFAVVERARRGYSAYPIEAKSTPIVWPSDAPERLLAPARFSLGGSWPGRLRRSGASSHRKTRRPCMRAPSDGLAHGFIDDLRTEGRARAGVVARMPFPGTSAPEFAFWFHGHVPCSSRSNPNLSTSPRSYHCRLRRRSGPDCPSTDPHAMTTTVKPPARTTRMRAAARKFFIRKLLKDSIPGSARGAVPVSRRRLGRHSRDAVATEGDFRHHSSPPNPTPRPNQENSPPPPPPN